MFWFESAPFARRPVADCIDCELGFFACLGIFPHHPVNRAEKFQPIGVFEAFDQFDDSVHPFFYFRILRKKSLCLFDRAGKQLNWARRSIFTIAVALRVMLLQSDQYLSKISGIRSVWLRFVL